MDNTKTFGKLIKLSDIDLTKLAIRYGKVSNCANVYNESAEIATENDGNSTVKYDKNAEGKCCIAGCAYTEDILALHPLASVSQIKHLIDSEDYGAFIKLQTTHDNFIDMKSHSTLEGFEERLKEYFPTEYEEVIKDIKRVYKTELEKNDE